ncbi:cytochrome c biogenesis protein ResB [Guyparkeria sp.]|uniref:cytochrome c biogenesis protein ResB n=1 Tax=Guyparkeria sp. TaxID=2035736 RepID=UPI0039708F49
MTSQAQSAPKRRRRSLWSRLYTWLTSMNLAIALLAILAIASVIGTVLQQNLAPNDYLITFGPFWFEIFNTLGLFDVYSVGWFVVILLFLLASTSACLVRNTPGFMRDMRSFRVNAQSKSLRAFAHSRQFDSELPAGEIVQRTRGLFDRLGYKSRVKERDGETLIAARKGGLNRIGYVLTHLGMVVILVGGLLDSKMYLKALNTLGVVEVETRDIPVSQVPEESHLPEGALAGFRGSVNIPEGKWGDVAFIGLKDGYVVQNLPFRIDVKNFHIDYYDTGMPKSFNSDIKLTDKETGEVVEETIRVNHPLRYKGYNIFQSSFGDGGSTIEFDAWQLLGQTGTHQELEGKVNDTRSFEFGGETYKLEFTDFTLFNVNPVPQAQQESLEEDGPAAASLTGETSEATDADEETGFLGAASGWLSDTVFGASSSGGKARAENVNFGPSVTFRLRDSSGQAIEYENYFSPVDFEGTRYFLSGVKLSTNAPQQFLFIPADRNNSLETFMSFYATLNDEEQIRRIAAELIGQAGQTDGREQEVEDSAARSIASLVGLFVNEGFSALEERVDQSLAERGMTGPGSEQARQASFRVVQSVLMRAYMETLQEQGVEEFDRRDEKFFEDALDVITVIPSYGSPIFVAPTSFDHVQSTGLEVTRAPGMFWVYLGSLMLTLGIFMLFYIHFRRLWVLIRPAESDEDGDSGRHRLIVAGTDARKNIDFDQVFDQFSNELQRQTRSNDEKNPPSDPDKG